jgi:DNA-binding NtrC family response regulator
MLQYTRERILDREFLVERCDTVAGLIEILARGPLDLVLLCQSVPDAECEEVIQRVREESPEVKVLVLHEATPGSCSLHSDATMDSLGGPPALLHEIHALLGIAAAQSATENIAL